MIIVEIDPVFHILGFSSGFELVAPLFYFLFFSIDNIANAAYDW